MIKKQKGFTIIEVLIVLAIIGILAVLILANLRTAKDKALLIKAKDGFSTISKALFMYVQKNGMPEELVNGKPPGIDEFFGARRWPDGPWSGSFYLIDYWTDPDTGDDIIQLSLRFCYPDEPNTCTFPRPDWAEDFDEYSSIYYCLTGSCRAHIDKPISHPGLCVNCQ